MTKTFSILTCVTFLLFVISSNAADKVVVIPLFKCSVGLTNCSGQCVDTLNNPSFCGGCTTSCGADEYCSNGACGLPAAITCSSGSECLSGYCIDGFCRKEIKLVFITSTTFTGNLGGLSGADDKCQQLANAANLDGTYKAWLADDTGSPSTRFNQYDYYYTLKNGIVIASGWSDLTDGTIQAPINTDENGNAVTGLVFSNTNPDGGWGSPWNYECGNWSGSGSLANVGNSGSTNNAWTWYDYVGCAFNGRLYCFEQ